MMSILSKIGFIISIGCLITLFSFSETDQNTRKYRYTAHLGCMDNDISTLGKESFDSLIALPLCGKDSSHTVFPIQGFEIIYAERGLYQDSAGLPIIFTDYTTMQCTGNTLSKNWVDLFKERSYKGDTVFIENIKVLGNDNKSYQAKALKIIIK